ncbi:hypothetical protein HBI56_214270 [Parastagonospora nodorum]|uniref:Uncharacterized protein n=1 Tax=Phaeosphaeria nodorum (strain SN15 / ATCC MYA-4574 / FGSC 10173) TaxID=321614 RepID=A0A7U2F603_PHANO|nr:hypothetical protein HBH56_230210 [Parastagonospora nodorum]QRC99392.1 hypothetical protein JI435_413350 [Parastagonospora nodorum SN15]KAH3924532.1 hypothetical protein HBH54_194980 [Parastagonospora nodorum]KAH3940178.1 hypothetical protein HBH53_222570 [Parastagonospora nodorum]KAH3958357.1 hypothetical protein HBH51_209930 [Parastagonospora nodorum]
MIATPKALSIVLEVLHITNPGARTPPTHMYVDLLLRLIVEHSKFVVRPRTQDKRMVRARLEYTQATEVEMVARWLGEDSNEVWYECRSHLAPAAS